MDTEDTDLGTSSAPIIPVREQVVDFYGDAIAGALTTEGQVYIPLRPLTEYLGLTWSAQRIRLGRDSVLVSEVRHVYVTGADGRRRDLLCLPLDLLPGWLFGLDTRRVKPLLQEKITRYRRECFRVLWDAFKGDVLTNTGPPPDLSLAEQALILAEAVAGLARSHMNHEQQLAAQGGRLEDVEKRQQVMADYMRGFIHDTHSRLSALELHIGTRPPTIDETQAGEIALAVKNVAQALAARGTPNPYQLVWGDLYRRYRVGAYRNLPSARYDEVLVWLSGWYGELQTAL